MSKTIKSAAELRADCSGAYQEALDHARGEIGYGTFRSRGRWLRVMAGDNPVVESGMIQFDGTQRQLNRIVAEYTAMPEVTEVYIEGGVDWAASVRAMCEYDYEPWVADWSVTIWTRD